VEGGGSVGSGDGSVRSYERWKVSNTFKSRNITIITS